MGFTSTKNHPYQGNPNKAFQSGTGNVPWQTENLKTESRLPTDASASLKDTVDVVDLIWVTLKVSVQNSVVSELRVKENRYKDLVSKANIHLAILAKDARLSSWLE